jgi:hypothetical protein
MDKHVEYGMISRIASHPCMSFHDCPEKVMPLGKYVICASRTCLQIDVMKQSE